MFLQEAFSVGDLTHWTGSIYDFMAVCQWIGYLSMSVSMWFSKSKFCAFSFFENCKMQHLLKPPHNSERRRTLFILLSSYLNETFLICSTLQAAIYHWTTIMTYLPPRPHFLPSRILWQSSIQYPISLCGQCSYNPLLKTCMILHFLPKLLHVTAVFLLHVWMLLKRGPDLFIYYLMCAGFQCQI